MVISNEDKAEFVEQILAMVKTNLLLQLQRCQIPEDWDYRFMRQLIADKTEAICDPNKFMDWADKKKYMKGVVESDLL